jgi:short-subunit dehydrogenase
MGSPASDGRVVVITGGTSGVGRATAHAFARQGARVALIARGAEALAATGAELRPRTDQVKTCAVDVSDASAVDAVAREVKADWGRIDVWVNAAVVAVFGPFRALTQQDFDRVVDVVLGGTVNGTRAALRAMSDQDSGRIIQVGSAVVNHAVPLQSAYCAAKHGVHGFSESLRAELLHEGSPITVSEVNLPAINTPLYSISKQLTRHKVRPFDPVYQPETAATAILRAARTGARRVDVGATTTATAWAHSLMPGVVEELLGRVGVELQQLETPVTAQGDAALYEPMPGPHDCHGEFDELARPRSYKETLRARLPDVVPKAFGLPRRVAAGAAEILLVRSGMLRR